MQPISRLEITCMIMAGAAAAFPRAAFLPWLRRHGHDLLRFPQNLFASSISAFIGWDVMISAIIVIVAAVASRGALSQWGNVSAIAGTLLVGVSLGLPLLLVFLERERAVRR